MTIFESDSLFSAIPRFRVLVNGFADGAKFPTLHDALTSIPTTNVESLSFEIYDALERRFVWTRPREKDSRTCPAPFSIWVNGHPNGLSFDSLTEAIVFITVRPPREDCAVFENDTCVFMRNSPRELKMEEALQRPMASALIELVFTKPATRGRLTPWRWWRTGRQSASWTVSPTSAASLPSAP